MIGVWITIVTSGFAVFKDRDKNVDSLVRQSTKLTYRNFEWIFVIFNSVKKINFAENFISFIAVVLVLLTNLYYCIKLVEGIVDRRPYKILPWICINGVNLVQLAIYFFEADTTIGYLTLLIFCYIWSSMIVVFIEIEKASRKESPNVSQQPTESVEIPYNNLSSDKQEEVWSLFKSIESYSAGK